MVKHKLTKNVQNQVTKNIKCISNLITIPASIPNQQAYTFISISDDGFPKSKWPISQDMSTMTRGIEAFAYIVSLTFIGLH